MAAGQHPRARSHGFFHIGIKRDNSVGVGQRTELRAFVERIADAQLLHALDELALELVGNCFRHDEALGRDAGLTVVLNPRLDRSRNRRIQIGAGHHDERIAAAQFQHDFLDSLGGGDSDLNSRLLATG